MKDKPTHVTVSKHCPYCGGTRTRRVPLPNHVENVGSITVTDGTARVLQCETCGKYDLPAAQAIGYGRRAAALALREGPQAKIDGAVVRYARKALGLRQADLASLLDVAPETVSRWEKSQDLPAIERATQLAIVALLDGVIHGTLDLDAEVQKSRSGVGGSDELIIPERKRAAG